MGELTRLALSLTQAEALEAIGEVAKLSALLLARHATAAAPPARVPGTAGLLDAKAAAERLGVPTSSVYRLVREERLRAVRIAEGTIRIDPADLDAFIAAQRTR